MKHTNPHSIHCDFNKFHGNLIKKIVRPRRGSNHEPTDTNTGSKDKTIKLVLFFFLLFHSTHHRYC